VGNQFGNGRNERGGLMQVGFSLTPLGMLTNVRDKEWTVDLRPPQLIASPGYSRRPSPR
jgi:hypothetical protein